MHSNINSRNIDPCNINTYKSFIKLGLIGTGISHSLSPKIHEFFLKQHGLFGSYEIFDVKNISRSCFEKFLDLDMLGLNVTMPFKVRVLDFVDEVSEEVDFIGAANTIKFDREKGGKIYAINTDGKALLSLLSKALLLKDENLKKYDKNNEIYNKACDTLKNNSASHTVFRDLKHKKNFFLEHNESLYSTSSNGHSSNGHSSNKSSNDHFTKRYPQTHPINPTLTDSSSIKSTSTNSASIKSALIIGTGGVARSSLWALTKLGCDDITFVSTSKKTFHHKGCEYNCVNIKDRASIQSILKNVCVLINASPMGMHSASSSNISLDAYLKNNINTDSNDIFDAFSMNFNTFNNATFNNYLHPQIYNSIFFSECRTRCKIEKKIERDMSYAKDSLESIIFKSKMNNGSVENNHDNTIALVDFLKIKALQDKKNFPELSDFIDLSVLPKIVIEYVYNPLSTSLLKAAQVKTAQESCVGDYRGITLDGLTLLIHQALLSFKFWINEYCDEFRDEFKDEFCEELVNNSSKCNSQNKNSLTGCVFNKHTSSSEYDLETLLILLKKHLSKK